MSDLLHRKHNDIEKNKTQCYCCQVGEMSTYVNNSSVTHYPYSNNSKPRQKGLWIIFFIFNS